MSPSEPSFLYNYGAPHCRFSSRSDHVVKIESRQDLPSQEMPRNQSIDCCWPRCLSWSQTSRRYVQCRFTSAMDIFEVRLIWKLKGWTSQFHLISTFTVGKIWMQAACPKKDRSVTWHWILCRIWPFYVAVMDPFGRNQVWIGWLHSHR